MGSEPRGITDLYVGSPAHLEVQCMTGPTSEGHALTFSRRATKRCAADTTAISRPRSSSRPLEESSNSRAGDPELPVERDGERTQCVPRTRRDRVCAGQHGYVSRYYDI